MHLLLVEDDERLARALTRLLEEDRHVVEHAPDGRTGLELAGAIDGLDAVILDIGLPDMSGLDVARRLRQDQVDVSILMLTARDTVNDRVTGLDAGADDYVVKPFAYQEVAARLRALARRAEPGPRRPEPRLEVGAITLDEAARRVTVNGRNVDLSPREFSLLEALLRHPGQTLTRDQLLDHAWPFSVAVTPNAVDAYVHYLRTKLGGGGVAGRDRPRRGVPPRRWLTARRRRPPRRRRGAGGPRRRGEADPARPLAPRGVERPVHARRPGRARVRRSTRPSPTRSRRRRVQQLENRARPLVALLEGPSGDPGTGPQQGFVFGGGNTVLYIFDDKGAPVRSGDRPVPVPDGLPDPGRRRRRQGRAATRPTSGRRRSSCRRQPPVTVPVRVHDRQASPRQQDGNTYYLQVLQDRSTEVETLQALLTVLLVGGVLVVAGRRRRSAGCTRSARSCRSATRSGPSGRPCAASASSPPTPRTSCARR